jgi:hypothetical protein
LPVILLSLPSNLNVTSVFVAAPVAGTVSLTDLKLPPATAVVVTVELFGAGPGLYFDLARLTFQTPPQDSGRTME